MLTLLLIGLVGGLVTGISPCILPVLPVIFFSGTRARPYLVIAGMVVSFTAFTLLGSLLLSALHLPQDALRWAGIVALVAIGVALIVPRFEQVLERPFTWIPQRQVDARRGGFMLGIALGAVYVPCAGPVLAAIVVAGSTGRIGTDTVVLTVAFAVGATTPLLFFALAGSRIIERVKAFRERQRVVRIVAGATMIVLAIALVLNVPQLLQRAVPDYTSALQDRVAQSDAVRDSLQLGGLVDDRNRELSNCTNGAPELQSCGTAPDITGITGWLNTPDGQAVDLKSMRGKVVLIDFWAYSCINCQRSIPHVTEWRKNYRDKGFEVIGVHTPEYAFEREARNVEAGARDLHIEYPIALDNSYSTWTAYRNRYWPAHYLIDAQGVVRHIKFGEGDYDVTERLIRELLQQADPAVELGAPTETADRTPDAGSVTAETYFAIGKVSNFGGAGPYEQGRRMFELPPGQPADSFALEGDWAVDYQGITAEGEGARVVLNYHARSVYIVVGGTGTLTVRRGDREETIPIEGEPTLHRIVDDADIETSSLAVTLTPGLQAYSFTFG